MARVEKKVLGTGVAGAAVTVLVYVAGLLGLEMPAEVAAAVVTVVSALAAFLLPHTPRPEDSGEQPADPGRDLFD